MLASAEGELWYKDPVFSLRRMSRHTQVSWDNDTFRGMREYGNESTLAGMSCRYDGTYLTEKRHFKEQHRSFGKLRLTSQSSMKVGIRRHTPATCVWKHNGSSHC